MRKEKIEYLSFYRAFAIIAVLLIHATSQAVATMQSSNFYYSYLFVNIFSKFAVPSFLFLTAFVLFYNYAGKRFNFTSMATFYRKRLLLILLPYACFSLFYFLVRKYLNGNMEWSWAIVKDFGEDLWTGSAYTHLYYIIVLVQFYLLFPLHLYASRSKTFVKYSIIIGLILQWTFILINKYELQVPQKGSLFISYISFWMLGAYIGLRWDTIKQWIQSLFNPNATRAHKWWNALLWLSWLALAVLHVQVWYWYNLRIWMMNSLGYEAMFNLHSLLTCLVLLQASSLIYRRGRGIGRKLLHNLGEVSFGVYLIHPIFLLLYRMQPWHNGSPILYPLYVAGGFVLALGGSWIIVYLVSRWIPGAWILFGSGTAKPTLQQKQPRHMAG